MNKNLPIYAIIDLGSNTFHLLIAQVETDNSVTILERLRSFVGLGDGGIEILKPESMVKGLETLREFRSILNRYSYMSLKIIGTAALRTASNSQDFIDEANKLFITPVEIIDGEKEADLIFKGVSLITDLSVGCNLIMDIGGGSTEFILINNGIKIWSKSYKLGVGVLYAGWHKSDPMSEVEKQELVAHLTSSLSELNELCQKYWVTNLIGASGSFEVLESMSGKESGIHHNNDIVIDDFWSLSSKIIAASVEERNNMEGLPLQRVKLIVVAMILMQEVVRIVRPSNITVTPYALKEGVISELHTSQG
jgi:exopolyphosphatase/guanosine-5'-triphosphate,3'-diphosphate pyrophosphatase